MGDANNSWRFELDGTPHEVNLDVTMMGKWTVLLDGEEIISERKWSMRPEESFQIGAHTARIKVASTLAGYSQESELFLDGSYVEPLRR